MRLTTLYEVADKIAPFSLSCEYMQRLGWQDNSGILIDCGEEIRGILFSLDLSDRAVAEAKRLGLNCIFTHHPAIFTGLRHVTAQEEGSCVFSCVKNGISVVSAHLNLDVAEGGIDDSLMQGLGGERPLAVMEQLSLGAYGKVYDITPIAPDRFLENAQTAFETTRTVWYGNRPIKRIASFCGAGMDADSVRFAVQNGADTFVSSDGKHHLVAELVERGMNVLLLTHYASENYGFYRFYQKIKERVDVPCSFLTDDRLV